MIYGLFNFSNDPTITFVQRFSLGKELLTIFIGSLGTLMGFYFAENRVSPAGAQQIANIAQVQNPGTTSSLTGQLETKAFDLLIKQDYKNAVTAFDDASKATPPSSNIANISSILKYLTAEDHKADFAKTDEPGKKLAWKDLYCVIYTGGMAVGQSKDIIDKFASGCNPPPPPTPTPTPTPVTSPAISPANNSANKPANSATNASAKTNKTP